MAQLAHARQAITLTLPPLRQRRQDIPELAQRILDDFHRANGSRQSLTADALERLTGCDFPGNIRELENCLNFAAAMADSPTLTAADLGCQAGRCAAKAQRTAASSVAASPNATPSSGLKVGRDELIEALATTGWSQAKAGRRLGLSSRQVAYAIRKYDVSLPRL